jgi:class 3 adenylate cyclase
MKPPVERRLTAVLATDVAGYSRLMGADEEGTHELLKAHFRRLVNPRIKVHRGRIVKNTGDGMLVEFPSVVDAVRCAAEIQRAMIDRNADIPEDKHISFRIGVNLGDVIVEDQDIFGDGVNIAARLEALAEPGGICISRTVREQIRDKLSYPFVDMGEHSVKNIARPVHVYGMSAAAVASLPHARGVETETGGLPIPARGMQIGWTIRLFLLVVVAVMPMLLIQSWHEHDLRNERQEIIRQQVVHRVKQLAAEIGEVREGARQMLLAIAQLEVVKLGDSEACRTLLAKLKSHYPNYSQLAAAGADGRIFCASAPTAASVVDQPFFKRAMAHDGLAVGNYWVDPTTGQKMIHFAQQFDDSSGHLAGVVFADLDLAWLSEHLKENGLPATSSKLIADREGNIIARLPHPEEFVGKNIRGTHERIMDGGEAGWEEATGVDGITRIFGYVPPSLPPKDFFLSIGEAKAEEFAAIDSATWRGAAVILAGLWAAIFVAWAGRRLVSSLTEGLFWRITVRVYPTVSEQLRLPRGVPLHSRLWAGLAGCQRAAEPALENRNPFRLPQRPADEGGPLDPGGRRRIGRHGEKRREIRDRCA